MKEIIKDLSQDGILTQFEIVGPNALNVKREQDVAPILDFNKACQNDSDFRDGYTPSGDMKHVARIPVVVLEQWYKEAGRPTGGVYGPAMNEVIRKKLNDPDNRFLRTGLGEV